MLIQHNDSKWQSRSTFTHLLPRKFQNCNSLLNNYQQENDGPHLEKIPHIQEQRRSPSEMVGGVISHSESNPIPSKVAQGAQTKPCVHQDPETPQETKPDLPLRVWVPPAEAWISRGLAWRQSLWLLQTWEARFVAKVFLKEITISPTIELLSRWPTNWRTVIPSGFCTAAKVLAKGLKPLGNLTLKASGIWLQNFHRTGETDSWRAQTKSCAHQDPGERSNDPQETEPDLPVSVQESPSTGVGQQ